MANPKPATEVATVLNKEQQVLELMQTIQPDMLRAETAQMYDFVEGVTVIMMVTGTQDYESTKHPLVDGNPVIIEAPEFTVLGDETNYIALDAVFVSTVNKVANRRESEGLDRFPFPLLVFATKVIEGKKGKYMGLDIRSVKPEAFTKPAA